jgi:hypothetical protein
MGSIIDNVAFIYSSMLDPNNFLRTLFPHKVLVIEFLHSRGRLSFVAIQNFVQLLELQKMDWMTPAVVLNNNKNNLSSGMGNIKSVCCQDVKCFRLACGEIQLRMLVDILMKLPIN